MKRRIRRKYWNLILKEVFNNCDMNDQDIKVTCSKRSWQADGHLTNWYAAAPYGTLRRAPYAMIWPWKTNSFQWLKPPSAASSASVLVKKTNFAYPSLENWLIFSITALYLTVKFGIDFVSVFWLTGTDIPMTTSLTMWLTTFDLHPEPYPPNESKNHQSISLVRYKWRRILPHVSVAF